MNSLKKFYSVVLLVCILLFLSSCSLFRTKDPVAPVDRTEKDIVIYNMYDSEDVFTSMIGQYVADNPYAKIEYKTFNDFESYEKTILNELAEGEGPDIFAMPNSWFIKNRKKLTPMPETQGTVEGYESLFVDVAANDLVTTDDDGIRQVYGIPLYVDTLAVYYNNDHFEDKLPEKGRPSSTWDGIKNDVYALNTPEVSGIAMGVPENISNAVDVVYALMLQNGVTFYDEKMSRSLMAETGESSFPGAEALSFFASFADSAQKHYSWDDSMEDDISTFVAGEVSMIFGYSTTYAQILEARSSLKAKGGSVVDDSAVKTALFPQIDDPSVSTSKRDTYASYFAFGVARTSEYSEEAWDILTFLSSKESQEIYFEKTHKPTSRRDLIGTQSLDPIFGTFVSQVGYAESFPMVDYFVFRDLFSNAIDSVNKGRAPRTVIVDLQDAITALLPQKGYIVPVQELPQD